MSGFESRMGYNDRNDRKKNMSDSYPLDDPVFKNGLEIGSDLGFSNATAEAQTAYDAGEIELWLAYHKPKTMEDWDAWEAEHGPNDEFEKRWHKDRTE